MELNGVIKFIGQTEQVTDTFSKREIVISTKEQYSQDILVQFTQDKCGILDHFKQGEEVDVAINIRGKEYTDKRTGELRYFNTIQGWKIAKVGTQQQPQNNNQQYNGGQNNFSSNTGGQQFQNAPSQNFNQGQQGNFQQAPSYNEEDHNDLPF